MGNHKSRTLAILGFHKVGQAPGGWNTWFYIPEDTFVNQLTYLRDHDWQVIDLPAFLRGLDVPASLPERSALLTFDDGCQQFLDVALPCLQRLGYPSVHFVPTDHIGGKNDFDAGIEPEEPIFTWDDLRDLERWNVSVQSHATSHRPFSDLTETQKEQELAQSKSVLEAELKQPVEVFAFPQGDEGTDWQSMSRTLRRTGY